MILAFGGGKDYSNRGVHYTAAQLKTEIAKRFSDQPPMPNKPADLRYEAGTPDPGYDREAALNAKITQYRQVFNNWGRDKSYKDVIASVNGISISKDDLEFERMVALNNFWVVLPEDLSSNEHSDSQIKFRESLLRSMKTDAQLFYDIIENISLYEEACKEGLGLTYQQAWDEYYDHIYVGDEWLSLYVYCKQIIIPAKHPENIEQYKEQLVKTAMIYDASYKLQLQYISSLDTKMKYEDALNGLLKYKATFVDKAKIHFDFDY